MSIMRGVGGEVVRLLDRVGTQWSVGAAVILVLSGASLCWVVFSE